LRSNGTAPPTKSLLFPVLDKPFIRLPEVIGTYLEDGILFIYSM
jgi:hypothetical protein